MQPELPCSPSDDAILLGGSIPPALQDRLLALRSSLERNGTVTQRNLVARHTIYRLRYRAIGQDGLRHPYAIQFAGDATAAAVRLLLASWKCQYRKAAAMAHVARQDAEAKERRAGVERHNLRREVLAIAGGGRRRQQWTARAFDGAMAGNVVSQVDYVFEAPFRRPNRRAGRPRNGDSRVPGGDHTPGPPWHGFPKKMKRS